MTTGQRDVGRRVLLVDDEATQLKLARIRLTDAGYEVETASGADEALAKARRRAPDAVMSDVLMAEVDGFALCHLLRQEPALAAVPVILLSAHFHGRFDEELALRVGASALVAKTPEFGAELEALQTSLGTARTPLPETPEQPDRFERTDERYRILFEHAQDAMGLLTPEGVILEANERWRTLLGFDPAEMVGRRIGDFAPAEEESAASELCLRYVAGRARCTQPVALRRADGGIVFLEFSMTVLELDGEPAVLSIGRDVTEHVEASAALAASEERYRTIVERIPDVIWTCTTDGNVTFATRNAAHVLGYTPEELSAEPFEVRAVRVHPDDRNVLVSAFLEFVEQGTPFDIEYRHRHKDGRWIWIRDRMTGSHVRGGVLYLDGIISDVTERKQLEEAVRQSQKMDAIGQLTAGIAHDFNNLFASILANSQFLIEEIGSHDPRRADAEEIKVAAERAAGLTRQLLAFSRNQVLETSVVDMNKVVASLEKMLRRLLGEDVDFGVIPKLGLGSVRVDVGRIKQVILNLVFNARDAMPAGGKLTIETSNVDLEDPRAAGQVSVAPGKYVMLAVTDSGCGMDAETQRHVFEPFFTTKAVGKGSGLGLSTCYGIVKQSGGSIAVRSEPGKGASFVVYLPRVDGHLDSRKPRSGFIERKPTGTVLLVEDDDHVRVAVHRMLTSNGYRVLVARSEDEAVDVVRRHDGAIDLVLWTSSCRSSADGDRQPLTRTIPGALPKKRREALD